VNFFRPKLVIESPDQLPGETNPPAESFRSRRKKAEREATAERLERDVARGYSINVKQVVLAFAVVRHHWPNSNRPVCLRCPASKYIAFHNRPDATFSHCVGNG
jgi:hypothetical protein